MTTRIPEPAVTRRTLTLAAGIVWALVGLFLSARAVIWFSETHHLVVILATMAIIVGFIKSRLVFARLVKRNIRRIHDLSPKKEKICVFAFQAYESYFIVIAMITVGILLRLSPIPREYLAAIYLAIGSALFFASFGYFVAV
jgi:hypothetical protein